MPVIFEYPGITIKFYTNEREPVHVHAVYGDAEIKVSFFIKNGEVYRTTYTIEYGKFPLSKLKQLKNFISVYKNEIIKLWIDYFVLEIKPPITKITKKI
jgi:hypothetical protein